VDLLLRNVRPPGTGDVTDVLLGDGRVRALGRLRAPVQTLDAQGAVLLPGLTDEHTHLTQWASARRRVDVSGATSPQEAAAALAAGAAADPWDGPGDPGDDLVTGHGFRDALWSAPAHRDVLDAALPHRPVVVVSQDLHCAWVNSAAAARFGITAETGVLREAPAMELLARLDVVDPAVRDGWIRRAAQAAAARGVTSVVDLEYAPVSDWITRAAAGAPAFRVRVGVWTDHLGEVLDRGLRSGDAFDELTGTARERVRTGPLKLVVDGSLGTRTAYCHDAYPGPAPAGAHGVLRIPPAELEGWMRTAARAGLDLAVHAIGDAAVTIALDGFAAVGTGGRIEHAQQVHPADLGRFAALGVTASIQPRHAPDDRDVCETHWAGGIGRAYPYAALLAAGAHVVLGSDAPVAPLDPWDAVAAAVHRSVDDRPAWHPEQHLTLEAALAAASGGRRAVRVGDVADLVLVEHAPADVLAAGGPEALRRTPVLATFVGGEVTHRAGL